MDQPEFASFYLEKLLNCFIESQKEIVFLKANVDYANKVIEALNLKSSQEHEQVNSVQNDNQKQKEEYEVLLTEQSNQLNQLRHQIRDLESTLANKTNSVKKLEDALSEKNNRIQSLTLELEKKITEEATPLKKAKVRG